LGNGTTYINSNTPVQVSALSGVTAIAGGFAHSLALKSDGTVWAWGYNSNGQLGDGTYTTRNTPVQVSALSGVTAIAAGAYHSLALKSDGTVWASGWDVVGQLGNGTSTDSNTPVQVSGLSGMTAIAGGYFHSLALKSDGTVWAWGFNGYGELGNGTYTNSNTPVQVSGLSGVTAIAGGYFHSLALKSDGTVWAWGQDIFGQLGNGTFITTPPDGIGTPTQVSGLSGITAVAGGAYHSLALKAAMPPQLINSLITQVMSLGLSHGETTSLSAKLQAALGYLQARDTADAIAALRAFIHEVNALVNSGRLTAAAAAPLISAAEGIIAEL
jgi:alpha-tubulin suppressor-like RCC1 family protein